MLAAVPSPRGGGLGCGHVDNAPMPAIPATPFPTFPRWGKEPNQIHA